MFVRAARRVRVALCMGIVVLAGGCGGQQMGLSPAGPPTPEPSIRQPSHDAMRYTVRGRPVSVRLTGPERVQLGRPARFFVRIVNESKQPVVLELLESGVVHIVSTAQGVNVWRNTDPEQSKVQPVRLDPGDTKTLDRIWDTTNTAGDPVAVGAYMVAAAVKLPRGLLDTNTLRINVAE